VSVSVSAVIERHIIDSMLLPRVMDTMCASMLHAVAAGNLPPAATKAVCVDINPAVVAKLADRGSSQTLGLVTDLESFLRELSEALTVAPS